MQTVRQAVSTLHVTACTSLGHVALVFVCYALSCMVVDAPVTSQLNVRMQPFLATTAASDSLLPSKSAAVDVHLTHEAPVQESEKLPPKPTPQTPPDKLAPETAAPKSAAVKPAAKKSPVSSSVKSDRDKSHTEKQPKESSTQSEQKAALLARARKSMSHMHKQMAFASSAHSELSLPASVELASTSSAFALSESSYAEELGSILKHFLTLPERVELEMALTISRQGKVLRVDFGPVESTNTKYVEAHIKTFSFPPFGKHFPGASEHTFTIKLSME